MHTYLKIMLLFFTVLFSMICCVSSLPGTPVVQSTPTEVTWVLETPEPSQSPAPLQPTNTSAPASLNASGPYILFKGQGGIWITNPDGSFPTLVSENEGVGDLRRAISPTGDRLALVTQNDQGLDLVIVQVPGGAMETITHLISMTREEEVTNPTSQKAFATYAIRDYQNVAWQPGEGRLLAFTGAISGPSADLYLYDTQTQEITQLTSGPSQAILPDWSPDGQFILNFGVSWVPPFGGAIIGFNQLDGVWAVRVSDGKVITLPKPKGNLPDFVGWQDGSHYITYDTDNECNSINLRSVDVASGETTPIMDYPFYTFIDRSPENGAFLFSSAPGCSNSLGEGTYLLVTGQSPPTRLLDKRSWAIRWLPESKLFFAYPEALISSDGIKRYDPPLYDKSYKPAVSMAGYQAWEVIENYQGRVMVRIPGEEWKTILNGSVNQMIWDPVSGRTLLISLEDGSLYAASYPDFSPRLMGNLGSIDEAIWLP
jgi:hypothetical protein